MPCDKNILLWILGIAVVVLIVIGVWLIFNSGNTKNEAFTRSSSKSTGQGQLIYFYGDWCPHCKTFMPVWDQLEPKLKAMGISTRKISDKEPEVKTANVPGFPCVRWYPQGLTVKENYIQFSGKRDVATIIDFVNKNK